MEISRRRDWSQRTKVETTLIKMRRMESLNTAGARCSGNSNASLFLG